MAELLNPKNKKVVELEVSYIHEPIVGLSTIFCTANDCLTMRTSTVVSVINHDRKHQYVMFETKNTIYCVKYRLLIEQPKEA